MGACYGKMKGRSPRGKVGAHDLYMNTPLNSQRESFDDEGKDDFSEPKGGKVPRVQSEDYWSAEDEWQQGRSRSRRSSRASSEYLPEKLPEEEPVQAPCPHSENQNGGPCKLCIILKTVQPTPPFGTTDNFDIGKSTKKSQISKVLSVLNGFKIGGDLRSLQLPSQFNLPKSQLQLFGESLYGCSQDLLGACAEKSEPLDRFLAVLRWHLSTTRKPPFGKAPYNPILGERHHVSVGNLNVLLEQVSHHPPISAMYATNEKQQIRVLQWQKPVPRFYGGWIEVEIAGQRTLHLDGPGEKYLMDSPRLCFNFFPHPGATWTGSVSLTCPESGYDAKLSFKGTSLLGMKGSPNAVEGTISESRTGKELFSISGRWDKVVYATELATGKKRVLYDSGPALSGLKAVVVEDPKGVADVESVLVWSKFTNALVAEDWTEARQAKSAVEDEQRRIRKQREDEKVTWSPSFYICKDGEWMWRDPAKQVPPAPLKYPPPSPFEESSPTES